ncbi:hypothetical protein HY375_03665 [Candidatus Berkelbacteria bacterium]|nr:hypothetical protein [Candidatus Berkelbacteria bacterium]
MQRARDKQRVYSWLTSGFFLGAALVLAILTTTPEPQAELTDYVGVGAGLVLAVTSLGSVLGLEVRQWRDNGFRGTHVGPAVRQALELASLVVGVLFLAGYSSLTWWSALLLAATLIFAELALSLQRVRTPEAR